MNFSHLAYKLRCKVTIFSGILSQGLDKTARRFVQEAIYGIIASESVMFTEIGRQMESRVSLKKTEERFSRQLIKPDKQTYDLENIRVLRYGRLKNMIALLLAVFYFVTLQAYLLKSYSFYR